MSNNSWNILFEFAEILGKQTEFAELLRIISAKASTLFEADIASILMVNPNTDDTYKTVFKKETAIDKEQYSIIQSIIIGWVILNKKPILIHDCKNDKRFKNNAFENVPLKTAMCVPIICSNRNIGYIVIINKIGKKSFSDEDLDLLTKISLISAPYLRNVQKVKEFFDIPLPENTLINKYRKVGLIGKSRRFIQLLNSIEAASKCDVRVVLEGETGTGKERVVKAIHNLSSRAGFPFIAVDCGAIPNNLIESELFGNVRGAFTGANSERTGLIRDSNKGTLFLDEISNLSLEMQSKLLRVLQEKEVRPVGSSKNIPVDVRFIAASSTPLLDLVESDDFRQDLYFRLMVYPIQIPTLDERKADIPLLADFFLVKFSRQQKKKAEFFHKELHKYLKDRNWKGNVRELENFVERIVTILNPDIDIVKNEHLPENLQKEINSVEKKYELPLVEQLENIERNIILKSLDNSEWNQSESARSLHIPEQTLRYKMKKMGIIRKDNI